MVTVALLGVPVLLFHPTLRLETAEKCEDDEYEETDEEQVEGREEDSELSEEEWSEITYYAILFICNI